MSTPAHHVVKLRSIHFQFILFRRHHWLYVRSCSWHRTWSAGYFQNRNSGSKCSVPPRYLFITVPSPLYLLPFTSSFSHCSHTSSSALSLSCSVCVFFPKDSFLCFHFISLSNPQGFFFNCSFRAIDYTTLLFSIALSLSAPPTHTHTHAHSSHFSYLSLYHCTCTFLHVFLFAFAAQRREPCGGRIHTQTHAHTHWCRGSVQTGANTHSYKGQILRDKRSNLCGSERRGAFKREHAHIYILSMSSLAHSDSASLSLSLPLPLSLSHTHTYTHTHTHTHTHSQTDPPLTQE